MSEIASFRDVIALWPADGDDPSIRRSFERMAADVGATFETVRKWWERDRIPPEWWMPVLACPVAKGANVTADTMAALAAKERAGELRA